MCLLVRCQAFHMYVIIFNPYDTMRLIPLSTFYRSGWGNVNNWPTVTQPTNCGRGIWTQDWLALKTMILHNPPHVSSSLDKSPLCHGRTKDSGRVLSFLSSSSLITQVNMHLLVLFDYPPVPIMPEQILTHDLSCPLGFCFLGCFLSALLCLSHPLIFTFVEAKQPNLALQIGFNYWDVGTLVLITPTFFQPSGSASSSIFWVLLQVCLSFSSSVIYI